MFRQQLLSSSNCCLLSSKAVKFWQESQEGVMNRDGAYQLSHVFDILLFSIAASSGGQQTAVLMSAELIIGSLSHVRWGNSWLLMWQSCWTDVDVDSILSFVLETDWYQ